MPSRLLAELDLKRFSVAELYALAIGGAGRPLAPAEAAEALLGSGLQGYRDAQALEASLKAAARPPMLAPFGEEAFRLVDESPRFLQLMKKVENHIRSRARRAENERRRERLDREWDERDGAAQLEYLTWTKRIVRAYVHEGRFTAASTLDLDARSFRDHGPEDLPALRDEIGRADLLLGMGLDRDLEAIGAGGAAARRIDLTPPIRSKRVERSGRVVRFTPEQVIRSNLRTRDPIGDPGRLAGYWRRGQRGRVFRRLRSDLKVLYALYHYGVRHEYLMIHIGFIHEYRRVNWNIGREPTIFQLLDQAVYEKRSVEMVYGYPPAFEDEWSRAVEVKPIEVNWDWVRGTSARWDEEASIYLSDIFAVRLLGEPAPEEDDG